MKRIKNRIQAYFRDIVKIKKSPESIAMGFAIGTLISILPTPGFNILLGLLVVFIFKNVNKFSLFGSMAFWNPITLFPVYTLSYKIGDIIFANAPVVKYNIVVLDTIYNFSRRFLLGNLVLAISLSIICYILVWLIAKAYYMNEEEPENDQKKTKK